MVAGRPQLVTGNSQLLFGGMGRLSENSIIGTKNKSISITASITVPDGGATGVLIAQGGAFGGFSLYLTEAGRRTATTGSGSNGSRCTAPPVPAGDHQVRAEFTYDGGGLGKGGDVALFIDGTQVGTGRVDGTVPIIFSADETTDVGGDSATPVSDDYGPRDSTFTGRIHWIQLDPTPTPRTSTTSSAPKNACASPWHGSSGIDARPPLHSRTLNNPCSSPCSSYSAST